MQVELEPKIILKFLTKENVDAYEILAKLQAHFEDKACALRTVRFWMGEVQPGREDLHDEHRSGSPSLDDFVRSGRPPFDHIDTGILHILGKSPFGSARSIAQTLKTSHNVVLHHLHEVLGFKSFHLR
jgi:hypothetical protein